MKGWTPYRVPLPLSVDMKKALLILVMGITALGTKGQQMPMFTQYMHNPYILNPAATGTSINTQAMLGYRNQWTNFEGSPKTFYFSMHGALGSVKTIKKRSPRSGRGQPAHLGSYHSVGGYVFRDVTGPTSNSGIFASYAYHLEIDAGTYLSMGAFLGGLQYTLDADEIRLANNSNDLDEALGTGKQSQIIPDAAIGVFLHADRYFLGLSARQILQNKFQFNDMLEDKYSKLVNHIYLSAGYNLRLDRTWTLQPSTLLKYSQPAEWQLDLNVKAIYNQMMWAGVSLRTGESVSALLGLNLQESLTLGYSYDYGIKEIGKLHSGSHEIVLGYIFK